MHPLASAPRKGARDALPPPPLLRPWSGGREGKGGGRMKGGGALASRLAVTSQCGEERRGCLPPPHRPRLRSLRPLTESGVRKGRRPSNSAPGGDEPKQRKGDARRPRLELLLRTPRVPASSPSRWRLRCWGCNIVCIRRLVSRRGGCAVKHEAPSRAG